MKRRQLTVLVSVCLAATGGYEIAAKGPIRPVEPKVATAGQLIISEFRLRGPNGASDEFVEIYNASGSSHTVAALSGTGYAVAASDGVIRCSIPNGTVIPNHGHFLCVNETDFSLPFYPGGNAAVLSGDAPYAIDIPDNAGIALFNNNTGGGSFSLANRIDAVGSTSEANTLYKEGTGYPAISAFDIDYSWTRKTVGMCALPGCADAVFLSPVYTTTLVDSHNNASDFYFSDTNGTSAGGGQRLGAPGPESLSGPVKVDGSSQLLVQKASGCSAWNAPPNRVRDTTSDPANNSTFGTLSFRVQWKNVSGGNITRLRFRIIDLTTFPEPFGVADLRPRTSVAVGIITDTDPCGSGTSPATIQGTTLEQPPPQPNGGGFNSSLSASSVFLSTPLAHNAVVTTQFLLGIQQTGTARFCVIPETLPAVAGDPFCYIGNTEGDVTPAPGDFDFDQRAEMPMYNAATGQWRILESGGGFVSETLIAWGGPGYRAVPGDYDGDGKADAAVYNTTTGVWSILTSRSNYTRAFNMSFGGPGFMPEPGDYDGDGVTDLSIASAPLNVWGVAFSSFNFNVIRGFSWSAPGFTPVAGQDFDGDQRADMVLYNENTGVWQVLRSSSNFTTSFARAWGGHGYTLVPGDYDGDGVSDFGIYNRMTGVWSILQSIGGYTSTLTKSWGGPGYLPVPADYDGDRKLEIAVYQPSATKWMALKSSTAYATVLQATYGTTADQPLSTAVRPVSMRETHAGDADGDTVSDMTIYNTTSGAWQTLTSGSGFLSATSRSWGGPGYTPVPGDYDGDGKLDLGLYQSSTGQWLVLRSDFGFTTTYSFSAGGPGYVPVAGDYDGDGRTDMMTYNTTTGQWFGRKSTGAFATFIVVSWGGTGYTAAPGDFDADGKLDLCVYQASTGTWLILKSSSGYTTTITRGFGGSGYAPVPADFDGDGITDFAVYQTATGVWTMLKSNTGNTLGFTVPYGGPTYTPIAGDWDGDGRADVAVVDPAGTWSILLSNGNYTTSLSKSWGGAGFVPLPAFP